MRRLLAVRTLFFLTYGNQSSGPPGPKDLGHPPIPVPVAHGNWVALVYDVAGEDDVVSGTEHGETVALDVVAGIPAVSEWGMVVLVMLVLAAGTVVIRRARALRAHT
jgi:hypothetical protein